MRVQRLSLHYLLPRKPPNPQNLLRWLFGRLSAGEKKGEDVEAKVSNINQSTTVKIRPILNMHPPSELNGRIKLKAGTLCRIIMVEGKHEVYGPAANRLITSYARQRF